jgi:serine/threonine-protein kinase
MREVLVSIARSAPREYPADVPEELADIVRRAMHADRNERFSSAEALGRALGEFERHRAAAALAKVAVERLAELEDAIARGAAPAAVEPLFHECRFGFEQSLRAWPENRRAREELRRALTRMCAFELAQKNRASAAALLALIDEPPSDLTEQLAALARELEHDVAERDRLRRLDHEMDPTVAERERKLAVRGAAVLLFLFAMSLTAGYVLHVFTPTAGGMVAFMVPTLVLIASVSLRFRKQLFQNRVGRQMGLTIAVAAVAVTVNRTLGYVHTRPFADILSGDSLILATLAAVSALSLRRVYLVPATLFTAAAIIAPRLGTLAFVPMLSAAILSVATVVRSPERLRTPLL